MKKFLFVISVIIALFAFPLVFWPEKEGYTQIPPPAPPPVSPPPSSPPVPLSFIPSVTEDIKNTKHNLSSLTPDLPPLTPDGIERKRAVYSAQTTELCIFCHTPHGASAEATATLKAPLWNRSLSSARYILYDQVWSTSFEAYDTGSPKPNAPTGYSRLCLSCHDGTIALGSVVNRSGSEIFYTPMDMLYPTGQSPSGGSGTIPVGSGISTGDTRVIGSNLQNDHPVSFVYDSILALRDEELVDPGAPLVPPAKIGDPTPISPMRRYPGTNMARFDTVQCTSCHNPHAAKFSDGTIVPKFLRANYYNEPENLNRGKIICLYCHDKPGWTGSSHDTATYIPPENPSTTNPYNFDGDHTVGQYACRACHDPHTVQGAKRLLREGTDFNNNTAYENTCYLCHKPASEMGNPANPPPDIRSEFYKDVNLSRGGSGSAMNLTMAQGHEPVFVSRPQEGVELLSSSPPPFNEYSPGISIRDTVHIECVDCHNPHQVAKTNRLKGMKGIDINGNIVGARVPGNSREPFVHEVCLRCHGDSYTNIFMGSRFPEDTVYRSDPRDIAPSNSNLSLRGYSNKRKEFDPESPNVGPGLSQQMKNPAYHPVAAAGRNGSRQLCKQLAVAFNIQESSINPGGTTPGCDNPAAALKNITIQCTDCHNNNVTGIGNIKGPVTGLPNGSSYRRISDLTSKISELTSNDPTKPQGPHGSSYSRILRNQYNTDVRNPGRPLKGDVASTDYFDLCFQCHDRRAFDPYQPGANLEYDPTWTNFFGNPNVTSNYWEVNLHIYHLTLGAAYCHECHNNVHSNIEAQNTIYGDGTGRSYPNCGAGSPANPLGDPRYDPPGCLPPDDEDGFADGVVGTHLINFAPGIVRGTTSEKPRWYMDVTRIGGTTYTIHRCDVFCHETPMPTCHYKPSPSLSGAQWCAGFGGD